MQMTIYNEKYDISVTIYDLNISILEKVGRANYLMKIISLMTNVTM